MQKTPTDEIERLLLELKDDRRDVRSRAAYELGKHNDPRVILPLVAALSDNDKFVRSWAAGALGKAGPTAVGPLRTVLDGEDGSAAYYAAQALADLDDLRAVPRLAEAVKQGDWDIRSSAASALLKLGDAETLPERVLADTGLNPGQRLEILTSLRDVAHSDDEVQIHYAVPDITQLCAERLQSSDKNVRAGVKETLEALRTAQQRFEPAPTPEGVAEPLIDAPVSPQTVPSAESLAAAPPVNEPTTPDKPKRSLLSRLLGR